MTATEPSIDIARLEKVRRTGTKLTARCPACAASGGDRRGEHFFLNTADGKFGCGAYPGDAEHRREIFALVGIIGERRPDPERDRRWKMDRDDERRRESARTTLIETAKATRAHIIARHRWVPCDVWENSPQRIDGPLVEFDPRHFIATLFPQDATVWTGDERQSGQHGKHAARWQTVAAWQELPAETVGPMISPATWPTGTISRAAENVASSPFVVLDFDGFDGLKPQTPQEINRHVRDAIALVRWIREGLQWQLAAIIWTGSKSIHAWFHNPGNAALQSLRDAASALGIDAGLIGRPEHPCRLPGQRHAKTGGMSRVLWLQTPIP
ncbi:MAG: hypothetical protein Q8Q59_11135 [Luteolibacter sp.]|jgi:hypothetical protein|nr:hypothetical protein [Luteolibacter sp.]